MSQIITEAGDQGNKGTDLAQTTGVAIAARVQLGGRLALRRAQRAVEIVRQERRAIVKRLQRVGLAHAHLKPALVQLRLVRVHPPVALLRTPGARERWVSARTTTATFIPLEHEG